MEENQSNLQPNPQFSTQSQPPQQATPVAKYPPLSEFLKNPTVRPEWGPVVLGTITGLILAVLLAGLFSAINQTGLLAAVLTEIIAVGFAAFVAGFRAKGDPLPQAVETGFLIFIITVSFSALEGGPVYFLLTALLGAIIILLIAISAGLLARRLKPLS